MNTWGLESGPSGYRAKIQHGYAVDIERIWILHIKNEVLDIILHGFSHLEVLMHHSQPDFTRGRVLKSIFAISTKAKWFGKESKD